VFDRCGSLIAIRFCVVSYASWSPVNGVVECSSTSVQSIAAVARPLCRLGSSPVNSPFVGTIASFHIWSRPLAPMEITTLVSTAALPPSVAPNRGPYGSANVIFGTLFSSSVTHAYTVNPGPSGLPGTGIVNFNLGSSFSYPFGWLDLGGTPEDSGIDEVGFAPIGRGVVTRNMRTIYSPSYQLRSTPDGFSLALVRTHVGTGNLRIAVER
jgi:hypothetical protein